MLKVFNISTLILFLCFLFAPTITFAFNADVDSYSLIINEEEETHSKNKSKNSTNNVNEEEVKEVKYYTFANFFVNLLFTTTLSKNPNAKNNNLKDDWVFKIPLPPPELHL